MLIQIAFGAMLVILSTLIVALSALAMMRFFHRRQEWLASEPHDLKLVFTMTVASLWVLFIITASVTIWATAFRLLGLFPALEPSVYFSLTVFTTLGFGDVLLPQQWRILGVIAAVNGLLNTGVLTAVLIETLRSVRQRQMRKLRAERTNNE